jgi:hypothetical protein
MTHRSLNSVRDFLREMWKECIFLAVAVNVLGQLL